MTSVAETLVDLAAVLNAEELARACHEAGVRHHTTPKQGRARAATDDARRYHEPKAHARGHDFRRYTYGDVLENPALMLAELTALLTRAASPPGPTGAEASSAPRSSTSVWKR